MGISTDVPRPRTFGFKVKLYTRSGRGPAKRSVVLTVAIPSCCSTCWYVTVEVAAKVSTMGSTTVCSVSCSSPSSIFERRTTSTTFAPGVDERNDIVFSLLLPGSTLPKSMSSIVTFDDWSSTVIVVSIHQHRHARMTDRPTVILFPAGLEEDHHFHAHTSSVLVDDVGSDKHRFIDIGGRLILQR